MQADIEVTRSSYSLDLDREKSIGVQRNLASQLRERETWPAVAGNAETKEGHMARVFRGLLL